MLQMLHGCCCSASCAISMPCINYPVAVKLKASIACQFLTAAPSKPAPSLYPLLVHPFSTPFCHTPVALSTAGNWQLINGSATFSIIVADFFDYVCGKLQVAKFATRVSIVQQLRAKLEQIIKFLIISNAPKKVHFLRSIAIKLRDDFPYQYPFLLPSFQSNECCGNLKHAACLPLGVCVPLWLVTVCVCVCVNEISAGRHKPSRVAPEVCVG